MSAYVPGEQPPPAPAIVKLNTNENPYGPAPAVADVLAKFPADSLRLYPDPECRALRMEIASHYGFQQDEVVIGNGSDELLAMAVRAYVENDGAIAYHDPSYSLYPVLAKMVGAKEVPVPLAADFSWQMPPVLAADLFFLTNPNAPTGVMHPKALVRDFCARFTGVVVIDEAYVDFAADDALDLVRQLPNVVVMRTFSKSYALAGLRVGYAIGNRELIAALSKVKDSYNVGRLAQELALAAFKDWAHLQKQVGLIKQTRREVSVALENLGFQVLPSQTNFLFARPGRGAAVELFQELRKRNIFVRHFSGERTGEWLRITIGLPEQMAKLLVALKELMGEE